MNWKPSGTGFEPKKVAILGGLLLILVYFLWPSSHNDEAAPPPRRSTVAARTDLPAEPGGGPPTESRAVGAHRNDRTARSRDTQVEEFRPSLRKVREANTDPSRIDPTLRLDLLAKLQTVKVDDDMRSLFEASDTPPVKINEPKPVLPHGPVKPMPDIAQKPPGPPQPPPPPAIPLKYYGFVNPASSGKDRRAFFLDGDDILVAAEGDTVQKRYKIIRIGQNSAVVEDTQFSNQQTLPIVQEALQQAG